MEYHLFYLLLIIIIGGPLYYFKKIKAAHFIALTILTLVISSVLLMASIDNLANQVGVMAFYAFGLAILCQIIENLKDHSVRSS